MPDPTTQKKLTNSQAGLLSGLTAYFIWGLLPIYFVAARHVPALELLAHRIVWSIPLGFLVLVFRKQISETIRACLTPKTLLLLTLSAIAIGANWGIYIWAIQQGQIFQASLGYYINPLFNVVLGIVFFKEKLSRLQILAIGCAFIGVSILTLKGGVFPYIALSLAITFGLYSVLRKVIPVGAMPGLFIETSILFIPSFAFLLWTGSQGNLVWRQYGIDTDLLILLAAPLTVFPLLAFAFAARNIKLSTLGIIQFVGPTLQFICGLYFGDKFTPAHGFCFFFIWTGVVIFAFDALTKSRLRSDSTKTAQKVS